MPGVHLKTCKVKALRDSHFVFIDPLTPRHRFQFHQPVHFRQNLSKREAVHPVHSLLCGSICSAAVPLYCLLVRLTIGTFLVHRSHGRDGVLSRQNRVVVSTLQVLAKSPWRQTSTQRVCESPHRAGDERRRPPRPLEELGVQLDVGSSVRSPATQRAHPVEQLQGRRLQQRLLLRSTHHTPQRLRNCTHRSTSTSRTDRQSKEV